LAPSDYCLSLNLKRRKCSSIEETTLTVDRWFAAQAKEFLLDGLRKLEQRINKFVELRRGDM
jgi:hypothetical protein